MKKFKHTNEELEAARLRAEKARKSNWGRHGPERDSGFSFV